MPLANIALIGTPIDCTGRPGGLERAPYVLRNLGLADAVRPADDLNDLPVRIDSTKRDAESGVIGAESVRRTTAVIAESVESAIRANLRPLILGGCCSHLMGAVAGTRRALGRLGLIYVDGHMDLYDGTTSPSGECADMPLGIALGRGPRFLDEAMGMPAPIAASDASLLGYRDRDSAETHGSLMPEEIGPDFHHRDVIALRSAGMAETAAETLARQSAGAGRYWLHLDWDVLDQDVMQSVDYRMPNGLRWNELDALVRPFVQAPALIGMSIACYNPDNDRGYSDGRQIVAAMGRLFG